MTIQPPTLPDKFDWWNLRAILEDYFFRLQNAQLFVPSGVIAAFGSSTAPDGWVACDGAEYKQEKYLSL